MLCGVPGSELDSESASVFRRVQPGGFILFQRNIQSPLQFRKLIDDLRDLSSTEPIITIDQEGGRVSRLREIGSEPPNAQQLRDKGDPELVLRHGHITGRLLRLFGINLDLCPVLDISFDDDADNSLRGRCYGRNSDEVIRLAAQFNDGLRAEGVASCGKHFPGYSCATSDAHHGLPEVKRTREELDANELAVFRHFVSKDQLDSMMMGHVIYPTLDAARTPTSLSRAVITDLLKNEMGFKGLVMTDDLDMGAIVNYCNLEQAISMAITAGNDLAMICHRIQCVEEAWKILGNLPAAALDRAMEGVATFKKKFGPPDPFSMEEFQRRDAEVWQLRVDTLGAEKAKERSPDNVSRSPVETY